MKHSHKLCKYPHIGSIVPVKGLTSLIRSIIPFYERFSERCSGRSAVPAKINCLLWESDVSAIEMGPLPGSLFCPMKPPFRYSGAEGALFKLRNYLWGRGRLGLSNWHWGERDACFPAIGGGEKKKGASAGGAPSVKCCWKKSLQVLALKMDGCFLGPGRAEEDCQGQTEPLCCLKSA